MRDEKILRGVHDERAAPHVAADAQEGQVAHAAFHDRGCFLTGKLEMSIHRRLISVSLQIMCALNLFCMDCFNGNEEYR